MTGRTKTLLGVVGLVVLAAAGWLILSDDERPGARVSARFSPGGTLIGSVRSEPRTFNPYLARDSTSHAVSVLTHARLVRINQTTQEAEPWLIDAWTVSRDRRTFTLNLRRDVTFSDGAPFTSEDVLFSFEAVHDERTASAIGDAMRVQGKPLAVSAPDAWTVILTFPSTFGPGLRILDNLPILPRHRLAEALRQGTFQATWGITAAPEALAGLGPFVLADYVPGQRLVFARNPRYWRRDEAGRELPYVDRVVLEVVPNQDAEMLWLETGQTDLSDSEIRPEDYARAKRAAAAGRLQLVDLGVGLDPSFLAFNLRPAAASPTRPWLQSVDLRRAVSHAVDRQAFANTVLLGAGEPVHGPITQGNRKWFSPDLPTYPYDRARARALLAGLGLIDRNGDGLVEDSRGAPARLTLLTQRGNTSRERAAAVLQEDLRQVGLQVDAVTLESGALISRLMSGDYDAVYYGVLSSDTDPAVNLDFWMSSGSFHLWNPAQPAPATAWERRIDELMNRQTASMDPSDRKRIFDEVQRVFAEYLPLVYFVAPRVLVAMSPRIVNATPALIRPHVLWNADTLALKDGGRARETRE